MLGRSFGSDSRADSRGFGHAIFDQRLLSVALFGPLLDVFVELAQLQLVMIDRSLNKGKQIEVRMALIFSSLPDV